MKKITKHFACKLSTGSVILKSLVSTSYQYSDALKPVNFALQQQDQVIVFRDTVLLNVVNYSAVHKVFNNFQGGTIKRLLSCITQQVFT